MGDDDISALRDAIQAIARGGPAPPVSSDESTKDGIDLIFDRLDKAGDRYSWEPQGERRLHVRQTGKHEASQAAEFAGSDGANAALVLHDPVEMEEVDGGGVRMHFNLEAPALTRVHGCAVTEAGGFQEATEGNDIRGERPAQIGSVAPGVEAAEVSIQLAFHRPDAGLVPNDQGSVDGHHRASGSG